jgi:hypothetical protein
MRDFPDGLYSNVVIARDLAASGGPCCAIGAAGLMPVNGVEATRAFMIQFLVGLSMIFGVSPRSATEPTAKSSIEISIVTKSAGERDLADWLPCFQKRPTL